MNPGANASQRRAAAPDASVWVAASAGTGKTKVLTDRLLALMLDGTDPARILCLTFTRAAAAEMANRLNEALAKWATLPRGALALELAQLTGTMPDDALLARARQLFAHVLDAPGGIKIATIHAFCQSLLRRFPLEAGVPPEFAVLEERSAGEALIEAGEAVVVAARDGREAWLAEALAIVARWAAEERFAALLGLLARDREKLRDVVRTGYGALRQRLCAAFSLPAGATPEMVVGDFCATPATTGLAAAAAALAAGSSSDRQSGATIAAWLDAAQDRHAMLDAYSSVYLTDKREIRDRLITKDAARAAGCDAAAILLAEAQRVQEFDIARRAAAIVEASEAVIRLGDALLRAYDERKRQRGVLDYDDLVEKALELLHRPTVAPWVLFKLDGGLDHILIDEAQDTNPEQWEIVAALAEEFFAGDGADERPRTVFAVGDAKQSIYSFQRADPQAFLRMRRHFEQRVSNARQQWRVVPLDISFRSTEAVLQAVDAIFRHPEVQDGVALDGSPIRHVAARAGQAGLVELWPSVKPDPEEPVDIAALPVTRQRVTEPRARLAQAIAATIGGWLEGGERLPSRNRAVRAGDVMVLVRRRNQFVGDLLRALKTCGIPVAGADRLVLSEQLAVQDLVALGRFLLFPEDDLTLATVLKGPFCGIGEEDLFDLAYGRGADSLWSRLRARAGANLELNAAKRMLEGLLARADFVPPYELYAEILGDRGGRRAVLARLGPEAADPIEEFLALALAYEREHVPSLQGFLRWLSAGDGEIKRDLAAQQRDEVRILTVHGAKGLEAPIVFLPDTMALPQPPETLLWSEREGLPLWCPRAALAVPAYRTEKDALTRRQLQEYRRLLYVGLTRAQDRLYICGWETLRAPPANCWHALCRAGLAGIATPFQFDAGALIGRDGWAGEGLRLVGEQTAPPVREAARPSVRDTGKLPPWVRERAPAEPEPPRPLAPSRPSGPEPATLSPLAQGGRDRFKRGLIIHRLLQGLPELPAGERAAAAGRFLASPQHNLSAREQQEIGAATMAVLDDPDFAPLFGPGSQAEVPLSGLVAGRVVSGQIDRLVVDERRVLIVDYKTLRPPPRTEAEVAPVYLRQLAIYRAALAHIFPRHEVRCALLWTEGPLLMPVSPEWLAAHLP